VFGSGYNLTFAVQYANSSLVMITFDHESLHFCLTVSLALALRTKKCVLGLGLKGCGLGLEGCVLGFGLEAVEACSQ